MHILGVGRGLGGLNSLNLGADGGKSPTGRYMAKHLIDRN